jgi:hypothetical protein
VNKEKSEGREKKKKQGADTFFFLQTWTIKSAQHLMKKNIKKSSRKKYIRGKMIRRTRKTKKKVFWGVELLLFNALAFCSDWYFFFHL